MIYFKSFSLNPFIIIYLFISRFNVIYDELRPNKQISNQNKEKLLVRKRLYIRTQSDFIIRAIKRFES